jgi:hypothetical protein
MVEYENKTERNESTDKMYLGYKDLRTKHFKNNTIKSPLFMEELDSLKSHFQKQISMVNLNSQIDEMLYLNEVQKVEQIGNEVEKFLGKTESVFIGSAQRELLFNYFK